MSGLATVQHNALGYDARLMSEQLSLDVRPQSSPLMLALSIALGAALGSSVYIVAELRHQKQEQHVPPPSAAVAKPASLEIAKAPAAAPNKAAQEPPEAEQAEATQPPAPLDPKAQALAARAAAEQALLEEARALLGENNATKALAALDRMKRKFPHGALVQDRELLRVEAYKARGQTPAAQRAARKFAKAYPDNPNLSEIESLLN